VYAISGTILTVTHLGSTTVTHLSSSGEFLPINLTSLLSITIFLDVSCDSEITSKINSQISCSNNSRFSIGSATVDASAACKASNHLPDCREPGALPSDASLIPPNSSIHLSNVFAYSNGADGNGCRCSYVGAVLPL